jgi:hypothetical protein
LGKVGTYLLRRSSSEIVPRCASRPTSDATNVLLILPIEKSVSDVTAVLGERTAEPDCPAHTVPSEKTIAAETPGYFCVTWRDASADCSAVAFFASSVTLGAACATNCEEGTATMLGNGVAVFGVGVGCGVITGLGDAVGAAGVGVGAGVGVEVPHAAATEIRIATAIA